MKEELRRLVDRKAFHIGVLILIIFSILIIVGFVCLRYQVEGEKNIPFVISKMLVISSAEGVDNSIEVEGNKWNFDINQNNDIYLYIEKNEDDKKLDSIKEVFVKNIKIDKASEKGEFKTYKPDSNNPEVLFSNKEEMRVDNLEYLVDGNANMKNMKITNQGGIIVFRCANDKIAKYIGNDEEINHNLLLQKANVAKEDLQCNIQFDVMIKLNSGKNFETTIKIELPLKNLIEEGTASQEYSDSNSFVFKRVKE